MLEELKEIVNNNLGSLKERELGEYRVMKKGPMKFTNEAYEVEGAGRLSFMKMSAMMGLMKMESLVFTPLDKDMPLINVDVVKAMGNITFLIEMYDVNLDKVTFKKEFQTIKDKYDLIPSYTPDAAWYDSIKYSESVSKKGKKILEACIAEAKEYLNTYIKLFKSASDCDKAKKAEKVDSYVMGLITNGGISTDQFKKLFGEEKTKNYLRKYMFGSEL